MKYEILFNMLQMKCLSRSSVVSSYRAVAYERLLLVLILGSLYFSSYSLLFLVPTLGKHYYHH